MSWYVGISKQKIATGALGKMPNGENKNAYGLKISPLTPSRGNEVKARTPDNWFFNYFFSCLKDFGCCGPGG